MPRTKQSSKFVIKPMMLVIIFIAVVVVAAIAANYTAVKYAEPNSVHDTNANYFVPTSEFRELNVLDVNGTTVTIGRDCLAIVADTSPERAEAIEMALANVTDVRPNAYDGWASVLKTFNVTFEAATIYAKNSDAYLARAIFRDGNRILDLDMRPSDAIVLALKTDTPVYLNMTLLREAGQNIC